MVTEVLRETQDQFQGRHVDTCEAWPAGVGQFHSDSADNSSTHCVLLSPWESGRGCSAMELYEVCTGTSWTRGAIGDNCLDHATSCEYRAFDVSAAYQAVEENELYLNSSHAQN